VINEKELAASRERCRRQRIRILEISQKLSALHVAPAFSCLELVDACYSHFMRRQGAVSDTFILSKGHGAMAQYVALESLGILSRGDVDTICQKNGRLGGHPDYGLPGIEMSSGSLGHGLPIALGMARADLERKQDRVIFLVMSDGEFMEGSVWEALLVAPSLQILNLVVLVDHNRSISRGEIEVNHPNFMPLAPKIRSFGWEVEESDGHDVGEIVRKVCGRSRKKPFALVGHTVKGKGVSYMENKPIWAYRSPNPEEYQQALHELGQGGGT